MRGNTLNAPSEEEHLSHVRNIKNETLLLEYNLGERGRDWIDFVILENSPKSEPNVFLQRYRLEPVLEIDGK